MTRELNKKEKELINELYATANECDQLVRLIETNTLDKHELKAKYKELKNRCKERYNVINCTIRPNYKGNKIVGRFIRNYADATIWGFSERTNGNLNNMIYSLHEASHKFTQYLEV